MGLGFSVIFALLIWRLTAGPISLSYLTPYFEEAFEVSDNNFKIELQETILTWVGRDKNLGIKLRGIKAIATNSKVVAEIPELEITISGAALLQRQLAPKSITIFGPSFNIVRTEAGRLELGLSQYKDSNLSEEPSDQDLVKEIIGELFSPIDMSRPLGYLRRIDIVNANMRIDDRRLDVKWISPETVMTLVRKEDNVHVSAELALESANKLVNKTAAINLKGDYNLDKNEARMTIGFSDLNPVVFSPIAKKLSVLEYFDLPLSGTVDLVVLRSGEIEDVQFNLLSGEGRISSQELNQANVGVEWINFNGKYDKILRRLYIEDFTVKMDRDRAISLPQLFDNKFTADKISMSGNYDFDFKRLTIQKANIFSKNLAVSASVIIQKFNDKISFKLDTEVSEFSIKYLFSVWPKKLAFDTRAWMIKNLAQGVVTATKVNLIGSYNEENGFEFSSVLGVMDYQDVTIEDISYIPRVTQVRGKINFNRKRVDVAVKRAWAQDLLIKNSRIIFSGLDEIDQYADVKLEITGSLQSIAKIADGKSLKFMKSIGSASNFSEGDFESKTKLHFLIEKNLTFDKVQISSEARLKNVNVSKVALDLDLKRGDLILNLDNDSMSIKGSGLISDIETEVEWYENFSVNRPYRRKYVISSVISEQGWREKLKLNFPPFTKTYTSGLMGVDLTVLVNDDGLGELKAKLDLGDTLITLPRMGWYKPEKIPAVASISAKFFNSKFTSISEVLYKGGGLTLEAKASFEKNGNLEKIAINRIKFGQTDVQAIIAPNSKKQNKGWNIHVSGKQLNLIDWLDSDDMNSKKEKGEPVTLSLNLDAVQLYPNKRLLDVNGIIGYDGWVWNQIELKSGRGKDKNLDISLVPKNGKRYLYVSAKDAGLILKTFDYYDNLIGGKLSLRGQYNGMSPESKFSGRARIDDFRVIKAPILTKLLNVASVTGIVDELLGGVGIGFAKLDAPFESVDNMITVKDASVSGLSLGMTATGTIDTSVELIDLEGTIVPYYLVNTALTRIPIIGKIFSGGEKDGGIFAANYKMTGDIKEPDISTNPLSVLAPGLLRKLFKVFDEPGKVISNN
jgi:hypothetical protein